MKKQLLTLMLIIACLSAQGAAAADHAVILQYHHFGDDTPAVTSVRPAQFAQHVAYLENNGFTIWPLEKVVTHLKQGISLPEKCVAITIDDAYVSIYEKAFPVLKARGWPFTVFVATEAVDKRFKGMLSWDQMREMAGQGAEFAPHTHTHLYMLEKKEKETDGEWEARLHREVRHSTLRIQEEVGRAAPFFAYPYGEYNSQIKSLVTAMGYVGFGQQSGPAWSGSDFGALPRFAMAAGYADMDSFITKVNALPLPVRLSDPADPVAGDPRHPVLRLTLGEGPFDKDSLSCFLSGQGAIDLRWVDRDKGILEAVSAKPLPQGRSRYNFTAPHQDGSRYFWYSHLWIRGRS